MHWRTRMVTNKILELIEEGLLDPQTVALCCLNYMSEADVADMANINELIPMEEEEECPNASWYDVSKELE